MHGLFEMKSYVGGIEHGGGVFGDGTHDGDDIDLLRPHLANAAVANEIGALHLTRNDQQGHGFDPGAGAARHRVGAAGAGGHQRDAQPSVDARIGLRRDGRGLLVMIGDIGQTRLRAERVHEIHGPAARDEEHATDALVGDESGDIIGETNGV